PPVLPPAAEQFNFSPAGVVGGGQAGFNWQAAPFWVLGIEADLQASGQRDDLTCIQNCLTATAFTSPNGTRVEQGLNRFGTLRGRAGWTNGPALFYLTGGLAFGELQTDVTTQQQVGTPVLFGFSDTKTGWTVGGGLEYRLAGNWTAKAEYLYMDLGSLSHSFV